MDQKTTGVSAASKERNEYIPQFIAKKPFYLSELEESAASDYLEHQRIQNQSQDTAWYDRGKRLGPAATKFRKGACENCGAMTHKVKECLDRPRKQGARWTGMDIQADEVLQNVRLGWDAKRDRWNGYDAKEYKAVVEEYEQMEELKLKLKQKLARDKKLKGNGEAGSEDEDEEDKGVEDAKYTEESDMGRKQAPATRNLRIREDTAKYLINLDLDSAKYDPKTRSMVDSGATADQAAAFVAEDNFQRASGDAAEFAKAQLYAWETQERGDKNKLHLQANPTSGELERKKQQESREAERLAQRKKLLDRYGGSSNLIPSHDSASASLPAHMALLTSSDHFVEYDEKGRVKGRPQHARKSKYAEDIYPNNHTSVWGSWWANFQWGYACCHSSVRNSYCTGEEGKKAWEAERVGRAGGLLLADAEEASQQKAAGTGRPGDTADLGSDSVAGRKRLAEEISTSHDLVTDEAMDEYRRKKPAANDPMAAFLGKDKLVH